MLPSATKMKAHRTARPAPSPFANAAAEDAAPNRPAGEAAGGQAAAAPTRAPAPDTVGGRRQSPSPAPGAGATAGPIWALPRELLRVVAKAEGYFGPCPTCHAAHSGTRDAHLSFMDVEAPAAQGFCHFCRPADPQRRIIQIRRNTYHDVLRVGDMVKLYDIAQIQQYSINNGRVSFLKPRPQMPRSERAGWGGGRRGLAAAGASLREEPRRRHLHPSHIARVHNGQGGRNGQGRR